MQQTDRKLIEERRQRQSFETQLNNERKQRKAVEEKLSRLAEFYSFIVYGNDLLLFLLTELIAVKVVKYANKCWKMNVNNCDAICHLSKSLKNRLNTRAEIMNKK